MDYRYLRSLLYSLPGKTIHSDYPIYESSFCCSIAKFGVLLFAGSFKWIIIKTGQGVSVLEIFSSHLSVMMCLICTHVSLYSSAIHDVYFKWFLTDSLELPSPCVIMWDSCILFRQGLFKTGGKDFLRPGQDLHGRGRGCLDTPNLLTYACNSAPANLP